MTYSLVLFDDDDRLSSGNLNSLLQRLSGNEVIGEVVVVIGARSLVLDSGLNTSILLRVLVAPSSTSGAARRAGLQSLIAELQLERVIQLTISQLEKLGPSELHSKIQALVTEAEQNSNATTAEIGSSRVSRYFSRIEQFISSLTSRLTSNQRASEVWGSAWFPESASHRSQGDDRRSIFLRNAFVCVSLIAIGAATLGLFLPSTKSIAANDGKITPTPNVEERLPVSQELASNPVAVPAAKPPAPKAPPETTNSAAPRAHKLIDWRPLDLEQADEAVELRLKDSANYLASDELEGRGVRTHGIDLAADYLAREFRAAGLKTDLVHGQPFQEFELYAIGRERVVQDLQVRIGDDKHELLLDRDFSSLMASATSTPVDLDLAFAGYGITSPDGKYDDYAGLDVEGKAVIVLRNLPPHLAKIPAWSQLAFLRNKVNNAVEHRAAAIIFCSDAASLGATKQDEGDPVVDPLLRVDLANDQVDPLIPIVHTQRAALLHAIEESSFDLAAAESLIAKTAVPQSKLLNKTVLHGRSSQARVGRKLKNVLASLPGEGDRADQTIVVGAHYDHLGRGGYGSLSFSGEREIHNGADDNASGTAVMLEIARQLSARQRPLGRRVLFAGFSGEELGLVGSKRYVKEPVVPLTKTVAMINLDMVGRLRDGKLTVYGSETSPTWPKLLDDAQAGKVFSIARRVGGFGPSDHASFYEKGIPVLHFFTGFHPQYHRPGDDAELLNIEGMRQITNLVVELVVALADPEMQPTHRAQIEPLLTDASPGIFDDVLSGKPGRRPSMLGVVLAPASEGAGLVIERTLPNSIAQKFGIRVGDLIHEVDGKRIKTSDEMITIVRNKKQKDELKLLIERSGVKLEVKVKF